MPPNQRKRKVKSDAVGRFLMKEKGGINESGSGRHRAAKAASSFNTDMPHLRQEAPDILEFTSGDNKTKQLRSVLERNALDEFLESSLASQDIYDKQNAVRILINQSTQQAKGEQADALVEQSGLTIYDRIIPIPRRPINYVSGVPEIILNPLELSQLERDSFLKWRLKLSEIEEKEGRVMTPFERNLEFWRQLWRVLERSDVVVTILDARNPLFFRSLDLENYVKEIHNNKEVILLLNKSDLVPQNVRQEWAQWFRSKGVSCLFFSALEELKRQGVAAVDEEDAFIGNFDRNVSSMPSVPEREKNKSMIDNESDIAEVHGDADEDSESGSDADDESDFSSATASDKGSIQSETIFKSTTNHGIEQQAADRQVKTRKAPLAVDEFKIAQRMETRIPNETFSEYLRRVSFKAEVLDAAKLVTVFQNVRDILLAKRQNDQFSNTMNRKNCLAKEVLKTGLSKNEQPICDPEDDHVDESGEGSCYDVGSDRGSNSGSRSHDIDSHCNSESDEKLRPAMSQENHLRKNHEVIDIQQKSLKEKQFFTMNHNRDTKLFVIGLVGYPNVGKSSLINSILGHKVVSVSRQPGKTKHFQTLPLRRIGLTLCDCPGLVFPQLVATKSHLVLNGVSPIDHVRGHYIVPIQIICNIIPETLINNYKLSHFFPKLSSTKSKSQGMHRNCDVEGHENQKLDATQFLTYLAISRRHFSGGKGGKLMHFAIPPDCSLHMKAMNAGNSDQESNVKAQTSDAEGDLKKDTDINVVELDEGDHILSTLLDSGSTTSGKQMTKKASRKLEKRARKEGTSLMHITNGRQPSRGLLGL